ncbi:MAG: RNA-binding cell elongation regulator Jag/EloR [Christensenellales bacterium]|jgi:spoIIIJ-associated protein
MEYIETKGKTVDEAVFSGLLKMDLSIDEVDIEIIDEGGGLFRSAKVRLIKKKDTSVPGTIEMASQVTEKTQQIKQIPQREIKKEKPVAHKPQRISQLEEKIAHQEPGNDAEKFLLGLFSHMGVSVSLKSDSTDDIIKIDMSGKGMGRLIGRRGETLDALQYLTSLVVNNGKESYTKIMLDTENYRKKREDALKRLAARLADKVQKSGKRVVLEPMNPYERRILHATLQDYSKVYTYSEGEDPYRSVVVALKTKNGIAE